MDSPPNSSSSSDSPVVPAVAPHVPSAVRPLLSGIMQPANLGWRRSGRLLLVALVFAVCGLAVTTVDHPLSAALRQWKLPGDLAKGINLSEVFGHSLGVAAILLSIWLLAPQRRSAVWAAILITVLCGLTANLLKGAWVRVRPHALETIRVAELGEHDFLSDAANPRLADGRELVPVRLRDSRQRSFPSGHAATAWGLALGLSLVFPRGRWLFAFFAALASLQRITSGAHFPTDVLAGAALAFVITALLLQVPWIGRMAQAGQVWGHDSESRAAMG